MASGSSSTTELSQTDLKISVVVQETGDVDPSQTVDAEKVVGREKDDPDIHPADGGKHAWLFLAGCFVFEALIWGK
jgi:hypothetical protein